MSTSEIPASEEQQEIQVLRFCLEQSYSIGTQQPAADLMRLALRLSRIGRDRTAPQPRLHSAIDRPMATMPGRQHNSIPMAGW